MNSLNDYYAKVSAAVAELTGAEIEVAQVPDGHVFTQRSTLYAARKCELRPGSVRGFSTVIPGYTFGVKTAISLPDDTYEQATRQAAELGISRSEFFARAARNYLNQLAVQSLTRQINEALQGASDDSNAAAAAAGRRYLAPQDDDW